mmetsp:Transcript_40107/g.67241  ORF Transcript_40107/g.67241 Transcript_40107/m.67241 type:complete len:80 (+) Transcript_40107:998-1237(+)
MATATARHPPTKHHLHMTATIPHHLTTTTTTTTPPPTLPPPSITITTITTITMATMAAPLQMKVRKKRVRAHAWSTRAS